MTKRLLCFWLSLLLLSGCGKQAMRQPLSVVDTPQMHYDRGKDLLRQEQFALAEGEFEQALSLDKDFAPAYEGLAWTALAAGQIEISKKMARKSLQKSPEWPLARLALARLYAIEGNHGRAETAVHNALRLIPEAPLADKDQATVDAWLTMGDVLQHAKKYQRAQDAYLQALKIDRSNIAAAEAIEALAVFLTVTPGQRPEFADIAERGALTRSDVAVLVVTEIPVDRDFSAAGATATNQWKAPSRARLQNHGESKHPMRLPLDIPGEHWAKSYLVTVLQSGVMEVFPDGSFRPDELITRAELAKVLQKLMAGNYRDPASASRFYGSPSPYRDVDPESPVFNAVMMASSRNLISGYADGTFRPLASVSGAEALSVLRKLKAQL